MLEFQVANLSDDRVANKKIRWIALFRQVVPVAGLKEVKDFFELLYYRGYDMNTLASIIQAAAIYNKWLADLDGNHRLMSMMVDMASRAALTGVGGSTVFAEMLAEELPIDPIIKQG